jgi:7,8-dihydropterin-6-yl-methyl-4-(beta-D-ribofuranosyl)aminobenzene 5'-phosphate synthase
MKTTITLLVENTAGKNGVLAEHGLAYLIETGGEKVLFDSGQGFVLENNLQKLNLDLQDVSSVVLSHGHYDHTGGLHTALAIIDRPRVYAHPAVIGPKFSKDPDGGSHSVRMPAADRQALLQTEWVQVEAPIELPCGLRLTGPIPRKTDFEDTGGAFYRNAACTDVDSLLDDQASFLETKNGTVVILGCAHSGVVNTLHYIQLLTDNRPIHTVIGGMHLLHADENRMRNTLDELRQMKIQHLYPCHCTGLSAITRMWSELPGVCHPCFIGTVINIEEERDD